jgi:hypothetical protein
MVKHPGGTMVALSLALALAALPLALAARGAEPPRPVAGD